MDTLTAAPHAHRTVADGDNRPHALVIGAGVGGLAAAIRLGANGYRVTVVDRLDAPGGRAYAYRQDGFTFDAGPTIITAPYLLEELWSLCGKRLADHVELRALRSVLPHPLRRRRSTSLFRRPRRDARRDRAHRARGRRRASTASSAGQRRHLQGRLRGTGRPALPPLRLRCARGAGPGPAAGLSHRSTRASATFSATSTCASPSRFHPLLIGGNPLTTTVYYCLIAHLERMHGVHYADGRHGRAGARHGRA